MEKHYRCDIGIGDNDMRYLELYKKTVMWMEISSCTNYQKMEL